MPPKNTWSNPGSAFMPAIPGVRYYKNIKMVLTYSTCTVKLVLAFLETSVPMNPKYSFRSTWPHLWPTAPIWRSMRTCHPSLHLSFRLSTRISRGFHLMEMSAPLQNSLLEHARVFQHSNVIFSQRGKGPPCWLAALSSVSIISLCSPWEKEEICHNEKRTPHTAWNR